MPSPSQRESARVMFIAFQLAEKGLPVSRCIYRERDAMWRIHTTRGRYDVPGEIVMRTNLGSLIEGMLQRGLFWAAPPAATPMRKAGVA